MKKVFPLKNINGIGTRLEKEWKGFFLGQEDLDEDSLLWKSMEIQMELEQD